MLPERPFILWASPPCTHFSVAALYRNYHNGKPKRIRVALSLQYIKKTLELIKELKPKYWFIENPRGMLRKEDIVKGLNRKTVTYCQYGFSYQKPTDIWTNLHAWIPRPVCKPGAICHESSKRGSAEGVQTKSIKPADRSRIPPALFNEVLDVIEGKTKEIQTRLNNEC